MNWTPVPPAIPATFRGLNVTSLIGCASVRVSWNVILVLMPPVHGPMLAIAPAFFMQGVQAPPPATGCGVVGLAPGKVGTGGFGAVTTGTVPGLGGVNPTGGGE